MSERCWIDYQARDGGRALGIWKGQEKKMKQAGQSKSESYGKVQGDNKVLVTVIGIGHRQLQTSYGQGLLCVS